MNQSRRPDMLTPCLGILLAIFLAMMSGHIDFHPDEAIYYEAIPVSLRNDSGAFYNLFYGLLQQLWAGPSGARIASAILGGLTFMFALKALAESSPVSATRALLLWLVFACSYQSIFVFVRVRPEAAWWCCAALAVFALARTERIGLARAWPLTALVALLPMNHRLSWFACAFIVGYLIMFGHVRPRRSMAIAVAASLLAGAVLNVALRAWWLGLPLGPALVASLNSPSSPRQPLQEFIALVFKGSPQFLNDTAHNPNLYSWLWPSRLGWLSHELVQNSLWALMIVLPFFGSTWKQRYFLSFPLFGFVAFWMSGYYNPTYSAGFSLFCVFALAGLALEHHGWRRRVTIAVCAITIVNGISFIATRVYNHGEASFFANERAIRQAAESLPPQSSIALPERYTSATSGLPLHLTVNYKTSVPADVDMLVTDSYDALMYHFVPDYDQQKLSLANQASKMCLHQRFDSSVYANDISFDHDPEKNREISGSWFFRNSASYTISIYLKCKKPA